MTEEYTLEIDGEPSIRFRGELLGEASSRRNTDDGGDIGRWTELQLYRTRSGRYICYTVGVTCWEGESDRRSAAICEGLDEVRDEFGYGWLAKELYLDAGVEFVVEVS